MLDADTKRRIDTARDILVGKVPDPKSQVEQITIALIYKFMDDMDAESEEWGGERTFFAGEFAKYGWAKLMRGGIGGHEALNLYAEAIARMPENPGIPPLFRDIFKNAYLPYRDPETLRAFLKTIDEFTYDHSERLGDAFEYLLSVLGSQGDAGQFRTPRHIIDAMVAIVDPKKDETVLDPACGTAGFLISALILDKRLAKSRSNVLFSDVQAIGVSLGVKRTPVERNDLPDILADYRAYYSGSELSDHSWLVERSEILANGCNLSGTRYRPLQGRAGAEMAHLGDVCTLTKGTHSSTKTKPGPYPLIVTAEEPLTSADYQFDGEAVCVPLISSTGHGKASIKRIHFATGRFAVANLLVALQPKDDDTLSAKFLFLMLNQAKDRIAGLMKGAANVSMKAEDLAEFLFPLPPLDVQREIVAEIEGYQRVIDGARAVVDNYRPHLPIDPAWPVVELNEVLAFVSSGATPLGGAETYLKSGVLFIRSQNVLFGSHDFSDAVFISEETHKAMSRSHVRRGDVLLNITGASIGRSAWMDEDIPANVNQHVAILRVQPNLHHVFLSLFLNSDSGQRQINAFQAGASRQALNYAQIRQLQVPLPPLETQRAIVAEIEAEQALVAANRELIARFERKIAATLARVWGEAEEPSPPAPLPTVGEGSAR